MTPKQSNPNSRPSTDSRFDHLARALARGASRRSILKGFAAGLSASLFSTMGLGRNLPLGLAAAHAAGDETVFLPLVVTDNPILCPTASTCDKRVQCSFTEDCRCLASAEGEIRCGKVPSCSAQRCTTSADCANLGAEYFCDSPGSGCCDDEQRCIAPCDAVAPIVEGTWTGVMRYEGQEAGIRFVLALDGSDLSGRLLLQDPVTKAFLETGQFEAGYLDRGYVSLRTQSGAMIDGNFGSNGFTGTFEFTFVNGEPGITADLSLTRTGN